MIGILTLNTSFTLHLLVYLPQVFHNRNIHNIKDLSFNMHLILFFCYFFDIFYGFSSQMQWQYKTVSIVGFSLLIIQYLQLIHFWENKNKQLTAKIHILILSASIWTVWYFFKNIDAHISDETTLYVGCISKILFIISTLPQIIKNWRLKNSSAISIHFILLSITIAILDTITAWKLNWGWPNKATSPIIVVMMIMLLLSRKTTLFYKKPTDNC
jgi:uncharacterized protein with PQ loop repeat